MYDLFSNFNVYVIFLCYLIILSCLYIVIVYCVIGNVFYHVSSPNHFVIVFLIILSLENVQLTNC